MNKGWIKYVVTTVIGIAIAFLVLQARDLWTQTDLKEKAEIVCDGLFVAGVMLSGFGLLMV